MACSGFLGAYLGGLSFDITGDYMIAWMSLVFVGAIAAIIQLSMDDKPRPGNMVLAE